MKKIFMASFVAMMAVTAANADIASTNFVTDRTGDTSKIAQELGSDLTTAINAVNQKIDDGEITITDGYIKTNMINDGAVTNTKIADNAVTSGKIANGEVKTDDIDALAVTTAKIAGNAVTSAKILDGEVKTVDIADKNVTKAKLADDVQTSLGKADSAMQEAALKSLASWKTDKYDCGAANTTCSLVSKGGAISWEEVKY